MGKERWKNYMYHETSPFSNMKMPKTKPIFQLMKPNYIRNPQGIPPSMNSCIVNIHLFQQNGITRPCLPLAFLVLFVDLCVYPYIESNGSNTFTPYEHGFTKIPTTIHNLNNVLIGLNINGHETLEVWIGNTLCQHHLIQLSP